MSLNMVYICSTLLALGAWSVLIGSTFFSTPVPFFAARIVPAVLAVLYVVLMVDLLPFEGGGFSSIADLAMLFGQPKIALAGWVHYLVVDLFIGSWELQAAKHQQMSRPIVVLSLTLTMLLAPLGLLFFLFARRLSQLRSNLGT